MTKVLTAGVEVTGMDVLELLPTKQEWDSAVQWIKEAFEKTVSGNEDPGSGGNSSSKNSGGFLNLFRCKTPGCPHDQYPSRDVCRDCLVTAGGTVDGGRTFGESMKFLPMFSRGVSWD